MRDHLRKALLETRSFLLKAKAGKYSEDEKEDVKPGINLQANPDSGDNRPRNEPESDRESEGDNEELEKEKVEFFRRKKPRAREAIATARK